ncbi:MAG: D-alanyl-D-alanine carboxypeptidase family protein [Bacteroidetes bacterium]|nr:MAG: D-alanyl-D-alanine carboxypeptidase family protein [Bacteroidota bacterium]
MNNYIKSFTLLLTFLGFSIFQPMMQDIIAVDDDIKVLKKYLLGQVNAKEGLIFARIEKPYTNKSTIFMHSEAYEAYKKMYAAASKEGIDLKIISAFRSFDHQKSIWEAKWTGTRKVLGQDLSKKYPNAEKRAKVILMFSSMPGTSRHHWGTDIDIYSLKDEDFLSGKGKVIFEWLSTHAHEFGFCQVYTPKPETRTTGYEEEKWHWSYKPVAMKYLDQYVKYINYKDITGFKGDRVAKQIKVIENYVLGINPNCKKSSEKL